MSWHGSYLCSAAKYQKHRSGQSDRRGVEDTRLTRRGVPGADGLGNINLRIQEGDIGFRCGAVILKNWVEPLRSSGHSRTGRAAVAILSPDSHRKEQSLLPILDTCTSESMNPVLKSTSGDSKTSHYGYQIKLKGHR